MQRSVTTLSIWQYRVTEYIAYTLIFLAPLFIQKHNFFPYTSPKTYLIITLVLTMAVFYLWGKAKEGIGYTISALHWILFAFLLILSVSAAYGVNPRISFFGTFQQGISITFLYILSIFSILIGSLIRKNERFLPTLLSVSFVSAVIVSFLTYGGANKAGPLGNTSYTGPYLLMNACFGIGLFLFYTKLWKRIALALGTAAIICSPIFINPALWSGEVSNLFGILGSANGAAIGLGISIFVCICFLLIRSSKKVLQYVGVCLFILFLGSAVIVGHSFVNNSSALHQKFVTEKTSNRFLFWNIAAAGFQEKPILGWGYGNYDRVYQAYFDPIVFKSGYVPEGALRQPHNVVWEYLSTSGIVGLLGYLALFVGTMISLFSASRTDTRRKYLYIALAASLAGYFFQNLFVFDTPMTYLLYFLVVGSALAVSNGYTKKISNKIIQNTVFILSATIIVISFVVLVVHPWKESQALYRLIIGKANITENINAISKAGGADDVAQIAGTFYGKWVNVIAGKNEQQKELYMQIAQNLVPVLDEAIAEDRSGYRAPLVEGTTIDTIVAENKKIDEPLFKKAQKNLELALSITPENPDIYFALAQNSFYQRDFHSAYAYIRAGIALAPAYKSGFLLADQIQKIAPNREFTKYIESIEKNSPTFSGQ